jgi:hypothetical protein
VQNTTTAMFSGTGVNVVSVTVNSPTSATVVINIDPAAAATARNLTMTTNAEVVTLTNGFTVTNGTPVITQVNPNTGQQGQQNESLTITGMFTHWVQNSTTATFSGTGVSVVSVTVNSATSATVVVNIDPAAAATARNVTLTTNAEVAVLNNGFMVTNGTPAITQVNPNGAQQGQQNLSVAITGMFTHWVQGTTTASFGAGITVATLTINSPTSATAVLNIDPAATAGPRNVTLTTNAEVTTLINGFGVINAFPRTLSLNRRQINYGINGQLITSPQTILVTIAGGAGAGTWTATSDQPNITVNPASGVGTGTFQISASFGSNGIVTVNSPGAINSPQYVLVSVASVGLGLPFGSVDTPINNTTGVSGAIPVTGWALDNIEVMRVDILREPVTGEPAGNLIFVGTAVFSADARPDVQAQFPTYPYNYRAGWGYQLLANVLPNSSGAGVPGNGTYKIHAIAFNRSGGQADLGTKTITVDNAHATKPFGTVDTPGQGGTISGNDSVNFGWALTPQPGMIAIDGSTMTVIIDGVPVGHPTYNQFRSDIATLFPGYANSGGAVGFFHINTTTLANGVHTISWNVFDNLARGEGLGSRFFNVLNLGGPVAAPEDVIPETAAKEGVQLRHGLNGRPRAIAKDPDGGYSVTMEEVGHIELHLGAARGNMLVQGERHALPIGSTLKGGVFYWQPGPGFLGDYTMQFERPDGTRIPVHIKIVPKRY